MNIQSVNNMYFKGNDTNLLDQFKNNTAVPQPSENDKITLSKDFIANLKYNSDMAAFGTVVEGYVNGKSASFKVVSNNQNESWFEGAIDKKYLLIHAQDKTYDGTYDGMDFQLSVDYNQPSKMASFFKQKILGKIFMPDYFIVRGRIGEDEINIQLPNAKVPENSKIRDLLTLVLEDNGFKAQTINGEVKSIKFSPSAVKNIKKKSEKREKLIHNDIKPIFMQGISSATGLVVGSIVSALLFKFGLKK